MSPSLYFGARGSGGVSVEQLMVCVGVGLCNCNIDAQKKRKMSLSSLYIPYLFDIIDREPHISVNIRDLFPMQPVNTDNGGTVW